MTSIISSRKRLSIRRKATASNRSAISVDPRRSANMIVTVRFVPPIWSPCSLLRMLSTTSSLR